MEAAFALRLVAETLPRFRYLHASETALHDGIAEVLTAESIAFAHEFRAGTDRFDFLVEPGIVIEVKIGGSLSDALGQVSRYASRDDVQGVLLATTCSWGRTAPVPERLHGKPFRLVLLQGAAF